MSRTFSVPEGTMGVQPSDTVMMRDAAQEPLPSSDGGSHTPPGIYELLGHGCYRTQAVYAQGDDHNHMQ